MSALTFSFENSPVNVIFKDGEAWFIASQVTKAIHLTNPSVALKSLRSVEKSKMTIDGRETNIISESGLYTLILRCQDAIKEGTPAFQFRVMVTDVILPSIRKTGKFECPANPKYITPQQGWLIQSAVQKRVHRDGVEFQTVYQALKAHYQIPKYTFLQEKDFDEAIRFIETCELRTPARKSAQRPEPQPEPIQLTDSDLKALMTFIYVIRFLGQDAYNKFYAFLKTAESPLAPRVWSAFHEVSWTRIIKILAANGFDVSELDCYQCLMASRVA